jgi:hypothetical protein
VVLERDHEQERLVRIEQTFESLKALTPELARLATEAAVRATKVQETSRTLRKQAEETRKKRCPRTG